GDHQIIYLLKFLEFIEKYQQGKLAEYFNDDVFVYANVPYKIKSYEELLGNPKDTIDFDHELDKKIREERALLGADGALLKDAHGQIIRVNFIEKILATLLAKMANFIPEGGIWMNTQRPEWNDANNALVGNGVSMVTLYYLRRFLTFFQKLLNQSSQQQFSLNSEVGHLFHRMAETLRQHRPLLEETLNNNDRKRILDGLGQAASDFRDSIYSGSFQGATTTLAKKDLLHFITVSLEYIDHTIVANQRPDHLYHAYNLMTVNDGEISISYLSEMLEGQVAVLSSGYLSSVASLHLLKSLQQSRLYREDQNSYLLYPNKDLPGFLKKNTFSAAHIEESELLQKLVNNGDRSIIEKDINGAYHFNGNFKNSVDLQIALQNLRGTEFSALVDQDFTKILQIFEAVFDHKSFTGRSGTFFGYEGLGSIYWHMVSKLQLAVLECCQSAKESETDPSIVNSLLEHYYQINEGILARPIVI
ncbi:MAG: hypothetical protein AAFU67_16340, partial [Bacteroidota bacterium]